MASISVYDIEGKTTKEIVIDTIPDGFEPDRVLIAKSLKRQLANARSQYAHVKTRSDVRGGGRKPFRQKGLGRARQGTIRAAQWTGGGVVFGPHPERNFTIGMNKKERRAALRHLIWSKIQDGDWLLFSDIEMDVPSTKKGKAFIESLGREGRFLVILPSDEKFVNFTKSLRNLSNVKILSPDRLNTFDLLHNDTVLMHEIAFETVRNTWQV